MEEGKKKRNKNNNNNKVVPFIYTHKNKLIT